MAETDFRIEDFLGDSPSPAGGSYPADPEYDPIPGDDRSQNRAYARKEAAKRRLDPDFVDRLFKQESGYNRKAVSNNGALGIGQLLPETAKRYGVTDPFDAKQNIDASLSHIEDLHRRFNGDTRKVAAGYFAGEGAAEKALANPRGNPKTKAYADQIAGRAPSFQIEDYFGDGPQSPVAAPQVQVSAKPFQIEDYFGDTPTASPGLPETNVVAEAPPAVIEAPAQAPNLRPPTTPKIAPQGPTGVEINLTEHLRSGQTPTPQDIGKLSYQGLGFTDEEAADFAKAVLSKPHVSQQDIASVFYQPADEGSTKVLLARAAQDEGGRVILPDLEAHNSDAKRSWLQHYRAEKGKQATSDKRSAEIERLAALPESKREDAATKFALAQEKAGTPLTPEERKRLGGGPLPMGGAVLTDLGSIIRGAGEGFVAPTIKGVGRLFGSEKTKEFGAWIEQTAREREALYGRQGSIGEAERTVGAIAPALATGSVGAMASLGALGSYGQGKSAPVAAAEGALTYLGLKGVGQMMRYIKAPNLFRGLQALTDDEIKALDEAVTTGKMKPADAAAAAEAETARRILEASKFFSADKAPTGLSRGDLESLQSWIASGRITETQAERLAQKVVSEQVKAGAAVPTLTEGQSISPTLEKVLGGAFLATVPTLVETAAGNPPTSESMFHNLVLAALAEGSGALKGKAETKPERGKIEEVSREEVGTKQGEPLVANKTDEVPLGTKAVWRSADGDIPVIVTGDLGVKNGRRFVQVAESKAGIPVDELAGAPKENLSDSDKGPVPTTVQGKPTASAEEAAGETAPSPEAKPEGKVTTTTKGESDAEAIRRDQEKLREARSAGTESKGTSSADVHQEGVGRQPVEPSEVTARGQAEEQVTEKGAETPTAPVRKLAHERFGEVTVAENQDGVEAGHLRVKDSTGDEHVIQNPRLHGNQLAAFVKPEPVQPVAETPPAAPTPLQPPSKPAIPLSKQPAAPSKPSVAAPKPQVPAADAFSQALSVRLEEKRQSAAEQFKQRVRESRGAPKLYQEPGSQRIGIFNKDGKLVGTASLSESSDPQKWVNRNYPKDHTWGPLTMEGEGKKQIASGREKQANILAQTKTPQAYEDIELPDEVKRPLLEIAQSFMAEGEADYSKLVANFEKLLGGDFEYVVDVLPTVVAHAEKLQRLRSAPSDKIDLAPGEAKEKAAVIGKPSRVVTPRGIEAQTRFALFESDQPITSHDVELRPNPHFPEGVQNRDRAKVSSEDDLQQKIKRFEPEYLGKSIEAGRGAPIVGPDMAVESGNGRVIMLRRIYRDHPEQAAKYRAWLKENAAKFGMTPAQVEAMKQPILAQIRATEFSPAERIQFAEQANEDTQLKLSPVEVARGDARKLSAGLIAQFKPSEDGDILAASNREFVKGFLDQVVGPSRGDLLTSDGSLNQTGVDRVRNAIFARAYADTDAGISALEKLAEETDVNTKRVINAMVTVAPRFVELKQMITGGGRYALDLSPDLAEAAKQLALVRESGITVDEFLRQGQLFGENLSRVQKKLLWTLNENARSATKLSQVLTNYLDAVDAIGDPRQQSFFSQNVPTKEEILEAAVRRTQDADQSNIATAAEQAIGGAREGLFTERQSAAAAGTQAAPAGSSKSADVAPKKTEVKPAVTATDRQSFRRALIEQWGYSEEVAHRTSEVMEALAQSYVYDLKQSDPKTDAAKVKRAFYETVRIAPAVKSVFNRGTFDPNDPNILKQGELASTEFTQTGEAIIRAGQNPNASSAIHEIFHGSLPILARLANQPTAPATLKSAIGAILEHSGFEGIPEYLRQHQGWVDGSATQADRDSYRAGSEKGARAWEGYFREGNAPTSALKAAFDKFKEWLSRIYQRIRPDMEMSDSVRRAFDRILGGEREQAALKIKEADHWNFRRSSFASPETEAKFRDIVRQAAVESGGEHKAPVSREQHLERVAELEPDLIKEVKSLRQIQIASREVFTAAAQYAQTLTNQAQQLRAQITPATLPHEQLELEDKIAALEHDATEIMAHTIGVRSEFGRNLALLAAQKTDQLAPEKVLAFGKKLAAQKGLDQNSRTWRTAAQKLVGLSNEIQGAQTEKNRIQKERKAVQDGTATKATKRAPWQSVMLGNLKAQANEASARLQELYGKKLYQEGSLTADEMDRVKAKFEFLKAEAKKTSQPLRTAVDDYIRQGGLFGAELSPAQQGALMEMANPTRRAALKTEQASLFETSPTLESRREQSQIDKAGPSNLLFQEDDIPSVAHDIATILAARVAEESQTKKGLPLDRILEEMRASFPDIIGEYEEQIKATADSLLKDARRQALVSAARNPEQAMSARAELARDIADARRAVKEAEKAAAKKKAQMDAAWEADNVKAQKEAARLWDKSNAEWRKASEEAETQLPKAEIQAQRVFERQQRAAVIEEAKRETEAAKIQEQARLEEVADAAREELKRAREAAMESIKSNVAAPARERKAAERKAAAASRKWNAPIIQAASEARARITQPDYVPTIDDLAAIAADKTFEPGMTGAQLHAEMQQYGKPYTKNIPQIRHAAAELKSNASKAAIQRRLEAKAAGRAEGLTKPAEQQQAREDYAKWQQEELARLAAEEAWQTKRVQTAKRDLAKEFAKLQKPSKLDVTLDLLGLPISLASSVDLPHLRQGIPTLMNHPRAWFESLMKSFSTWTEGQMETRLNELERSPLAELAHLSGLKQSGLEARRNPLSRLAREEQFQNRIAQMVPHVRVSERQYTTGMDVMRYKVFELHAEKMLNKFPPALHPEMYSEIARIVNIMTGVGDLGSFTHYAPFLNRFVLYATRYLVSRFQLLGMLRSPAFYRGQPWEVRKIAAKEAYGYVGKMALLFGALAAVGLTSLDVDDDDFLKLRVPKTNQKWDLTGGMGGYVKTLFKLARSAYRKSTGQREFAGDSAGDTIQQFVRSKLAPAPATLWDWKTGKTYTGEPFTWGGKVGELVTPMVARDIFDAIKTDGARGAVMIPFGLLGGNVSTYRSRKMPDRTQSEAERYATGFLRENMGQTSENPADYKRRTLITELAAAKKAGKPTDRIERDLAAAGGPLSPKEQERVTERVAQTPLEHAYPHLHEDQKAEVLKVATDAEKQMIEPHYRKIEELQDRFVNALKAQPGFADKSPQEQKEAIKKALSYARTLVHKAAKRSRASIPAPQ